MTNTTKSPTRDRSTTTTKKEEIESMEQLSQVTGGGNFLHLEVPDTYIFVGPVHR